MKLGHTAVFSTLVLLGGMVGTALGGMSPTGCFRRTGDRLRSRRDVVIFGFLVDRRPGSVAVHANLVICAVS